MDHFTLISNMNTNGGVRNCLIRSDVDGSALYGRSDLGCRAGCLLGSLLHGSNKSFVPTSSAGFKLPIETTQFYQFLFRAGKSLNIG